MPHINARRRSAAPVALLLVLASLLLAACGGSSSTSSTAASAAASTSSGAQGTPARRFSALRECLQKNGITLPKRTPGQGGQGLLGGAGAAGGPQLPKGVTRAQYEAAVKKCGGSPGGRFPRAGGGRNFASPAFKQALVKFATCMRQSGIAVPAPNTSGKGPVFNTNGLNTASAKFKAAEAKCSPLLRDSLRAQPGAGAAAPPAAAG
jgi:hypothetical protein